MRRLAELEPWRHISTAPKDGTKFMGKAIFRRWDGPNSYQQRRTWYGKASHVPLYGWCHGRAGNVDLWEPQAWRPL